MHTELGVGRGRGRGQMDVQPPVHTCPHLPMCTSPSHTNPSPFTEKYEWKHYLGFGVGNGTKCRPRMIRICFYLLITSQCGIYTSVQFPIRSLDQRRYNDPRGHQIKLFFAIEFIAICQHFYTECSISFWFICSDWSDHKMPHQIYSLTPKLSYTFIDTTTVQFVC